MKKFDLVIIGGGVAGLVSASGAAQLGAKVALIEKASLGGDCLRTGCVPTKRLIRSARVASLVRRAGEFGVSAENVKVDFRKVMEGVRAIQARIGEHDSPERFRSMGVEVVFGSGRFTDPFTFEAGAETYQGRRFIIATGSSPAMPPIPGIHESGVLTNETALELDRLPGEIIILGAGPIGMEFAQAFTRLGSKVTVIERQTTILPREDKEMTDELTEMLREEGITIEFSAEVIEIKQEGPKKTVKIFSPSGKKEFTADAVMAAAGRKPNIDGLGLEAAGVSFDKRKGIFTDAHLRTDAGHIYACGDCAGPYAFTHVAEYQAGVALGNALFPVKRKTDYTVVPWTTFLDPELARVGLTESEARDRFGDGNVKVYRFGLKDVDRAVIEGEGRGLVKVVCSKSKKILGAHILGPRAGELIHEFVLAMGADLPVTAISRLIHVYPTLSMGDKRVCDEYYRERLFTGWVPRLAKRFLRRTD